MYTIVLEVIDLLTSKNNVFVYLRLIQCSYQLVLKKRAAFRFFYKLNFKTSRLTKTRLSDGRPTPYSIAPTKDRFLIEVPRL